MRKTFQQIIAEKKAKDHHRVMHPNDSLMDPKAFKEVMRKAHEEYLLKSWASWHRLKNVVLQ